MIKFLIKIAAATFAVICVSSYVPTMGHFPFAAAKEEPRPSDLPTIVPKLSSSSPSVRFEVLGEIEAIIVLNHIERAIRDGLNDHIIPFLDDPEDGTRERAAIIVGRLRTPKALAALIDRLPAHDYHWRVKLAKAIAENYESPAIIALASIAKSPDPWVRLGASTGYQYMAWMERENDYNAFVIKDALAALDAGLDRADAAAIAGAFEYYLGQGDPRALPLLVEALHSYGNPAMADIMMTSRQADLMQAARKWATEHGQPIDTDDDDDDFLHWGTRRLGCCAGGRRDDRPDD